MLNHTYPELDNNNFVGIPPDGSGIGFLWAGTHCLPRAHPQVDHVQPIHTPTGGLAGASESYHENLDQFVR